MNIALTFGLDRTHSLTAFRTFANCVEVQDAIYGLIHEEYSSGRPASRPQPSAFALARDIFTLRRLGLDPPRFLSETSTNPRYPAAEGVAQCFEALERERVAREMLPFRNSHFVTALVYTYIVHHHLSRPGVNWQWERFNCYRGLEEKAASEIWAAFAASSWYKGPEWDEAVRNLAVASSVEVFDIGRHLHTIVEAGDELFISQYSLMGLIKEKEKK